MIFPIDFPIEDVSEGAKASSEWKFMFQFLAGSLTVLALILLFGIFCDKKNGTDDTNDDIAMMDENGATIDSSNLLWLLQGVIIRKWILAELILISNLMINFVS